MKESFIATFFQKQRVACINRLPSVKQTRLCREGTRAEKLRLVIMKTAIEAKTPGCLRNRLGAVKDQERENNET